MAMVVQKTPGTVVFKVINHVLMAALVIVCLVPMLHVLFASFSDPAWVMNKSGLIIWPHGANIEGYRLVFGTKQLMNSYRNTFGRPGHAGGTE